MKITMTCPCGATMGVEEEDGSQTSVYFRKIVAEWSAKHADCPAKYGPAHGGDHE